MTTAPVRTAQEHQNDHIAPFSLPSARPCAPAPALGLLLALSGCNNFSGDEQQQAEVIGNFYRIHLKNHARACPRLRNSSSSNRWSAGPVLPADPR
jgi:hypothetical protein